MTSHIGTPTAKRKMERDRVGIAGSDLKTSSASSIFGGRAIVGGGLDASAG